MNASKFTPPTPPPSLLARLSPLARAAVLALAVFGATRLPAALAPAGAAAPPTRACAGVPTEIGHWTVAPAGALPNARAVVGCAVGAGKGRREFQVWHATGRPFVVARQSLLEDAEARDCVVEVARGALGDAAVVAAFGAGAMGVNPRLVDPEPSWVERGVEEGLRLPAAARFVGEDRMGKLYLDVEVRPGGFQGKKPTMQEVEFKGWAAMAAAFNGGGRHLDWGTGTSSHFACGVYAHVHAIDSQLKYCDVVQSQLTPEQSRCGKIEMNCVDVGKLAAFAHPIPNVTDPFYFSKYVNAVDGFRRAPYYDSILVDGRFRVACAVKALGYLRRDSLLMIHDYPRTYDPILDYVDLVVKYGTLAVFAPKRDMAPGSDANYTKYPDVLR